LRVSQRLAAGRGESGGDTPKSSTAHGHSRADIEASGQCVTENVRTRRLVDFLRGEIHTFPGDSASDPAQPSCRLAILFERFETAERTNTAADEPRSRVDTLALVIRASSHQNAADTGAHHLPAETLRTHHHTRDDTIQRGILNRTPRRADRTGDIR
jgi:hypothetical protein